jgi:hypothetical protein
VTESGRTYGYSKRLDFDAIAFQDDRSAAICALKGHACFIVTHPAFTSIE